MWELVPKIERPEAQVVLTLPNGEQESIDGFLYQEFRPVEEESGRPVGSRQSAVGSPDGPSRLPTAYCLLPTGRPPHTRYRYRPRMAGTHLWVHRSPLG